MAFCGRSRKYPGWSWRSVAAVPVARLAPAHGGVGARLLFSHATIERRDRTAGWAHSAIFYGFIALFAGTVILGFETDFTDPVFGWNYFHGGFYLAYKEVLNLLDRAGRGRARDDGSPRDRAPAQARLRAAGPCSRRAAVRPAGLSRGGLGVRGDLLVIALTGFLLRGCGSRWTTRATPVPSSAAGSRRNGSARVEPRAAGGGCVTGSGGFTGCWRSLRREHPLHQGGAHVQLLGACRCATRSRESACARSRPTGRAAPGYGALVDFSPRHLLELDACTKCGRCHEACPAFATGRPLSPRT